MKTSELIWTAPAQQAIYRQLLQAASFPGEVVEFDSESAWLSVLATLVDDAATLADPHGMIDDRTREFLRCPIMNSHEGDFLLARAVAAPDANLNPRIGTLESPELGATLVLVGEQVGEGPLRLVLSGPGIEHETELRLTGFHPAWLRQRNEWNANFPQGVDLVLCDAQRTAVLPRTTTMRLEV